MNFIKKQIEVIKRNDPSIKSTWECFFHPSMIFMINYKLSNFFYRHKLYFLARVIANHLRAKLGIDVHPNAKIKSSLFIDHGIGIIIGETCVIGDNVIMYHGVTLGSRKLIKGKRHPTIEDNVFIGAGAKILGNITIGASAKIGANSVIINDVEPNSTYVGVLARKVK